MRDVADFAGVVALATTAGVRGAGLADCWTDLAAGGRADLAATLAGAFGAGWDLLDAAFAVLPSFFAT